MTTPAPPQQYPPGQQPPPPSLAPAAEAALVTAIAGLLLTAVSAAAVIEALKLRFTLSQDMWSALSGSAGVAMASPPPVTGVIGPASAQTGRQNLARRAQFVVSAAKRLAADVRQARAQGKPVRQALTDGLARERRYYGMHVAAMWNRATAAGKTDMAAVEHGDLLGWNTIIDGRESAECRRADGFNYRASAMPEIGFPGSVHPHCFPAGTVAASPAIRAAAMRWYSGELIELTTLGGHHLAVTPNHPVLTPQGWVAAGLLDEGREVVSTRFAQPLLNLVDPHNHQQPALIEDVLRSFSEHPGVLPCSVPVAAEDFHGDTGGRDGEVAVIWADRVLMNDLETAQSQPCRIQEFGGESRYGAVPFLGHGAPLFPGFSGTPHGVMGRSGVARVLLGGAIRHHEPVGVGVAAARNPVAFQDPLDDDAAALMHFRQLVFAGTVGIGGTDEVLGEFARSQARTLPALHGKVIGGPLVAERATLSQTLGQQPLRDVQVVSDLLVSEVAGLVEFDRLVKVHRRASWSGHVFNLESSDGWLITDNIVTHNCRCFPGPPHPGASLLPSRGRTFARAA